MGIKQPLFVPEGGQTASRRQVNMRHAGNRLKTGERKDELLGKWKDSQSSIIFARPSGSCLAEVERRK
jgi:hypothetical protein